MSEPSAGDFTARADAYARARPTYPVEIVTRLCARAGIEQGAPVVELGAGTGLLTERLAEAGLEVIAVEPNDAMRAHAPTLPGVDWRAGTFEACPVPDHSAAWVVAAQAFHWADPPRALPELRRILQPGAALSVLWNDRDLEASTLLRFTRQLIEDMVPRFDEGYRFRDWSAVLTSTGDFTEVETDEVRHAIPMSHARFLDLWRSHNKLNHACREIGIDGFLTRLEAELAARYPDPVEIPYRCRAWTAR